MLSDIGYSDYQSLTQLKSAQSRTYLKKDKLRECIILHHLKKGWSPEGLPTC
jgi:hypothetical protein